MLLGTQVTDAQGAALSLDDGIALSMRLLRESAAGKGKTMLVGNGGSAAIVSHVQNDLCKAVGIRALVFTESPLLTALANDHGYGSAFERPVELWSEPGDVLIAVSSGGRSENIVRAAVAAQQRGCRLITFTGFDSNNTLRVMGDVNFYVASRVYGFVETAHTVLLHFLTDRLMWQRDAETQGNRQTEQETKGTDNE